jgi:hypothetical protein
MIDYLFSSDNKYRELRRHLINKFKTSVLLYFEGTSFDYDTFSMELEKYKIRFFMKVFHASMFKTKPTKTSIQCGAGDDGWLVITINHEYELLEEIKVLIEMLVSNSEMFYQITQKKIIEKEA